VRVVIPPLRERRDDIEMLVKLFYCQHLGNPDAVPPLELLRTMMSGAWHGNVRELRSAVERALMGVPSLEDADSSEAKPGIPFRMAKSLAALDWEKRYLSELMPAHDGNVSRAARAAKMNRSHLSELIHRHGFAVTTTPENDAIREDDVISTEDAACCDE
jgi:DNA-binding NtrC family response regulator